MGTRRIRAVATAASLLAASLIGSSAAQAQQSTGIITGRVTEAVSGAPIPAVSVQIGTSALGTQTNQAGEFTIRGVPVGRQAIRLLRVGYEERRDTVTVTAGQTTTYNATMRAVAVTLNPVVTTATGEQRRVEVGNAIGQINVAQRVEERPVANMGDLLTAQTPGVQVLPGNATGTGARVRIRGTSSLSLSNDPIYVIDGIRMQSSTNSTALGIGGSTPSRVNDLNPEDIESIEVIRGPSAATLYGTDAANGVIVITTKKGIAGRPRWTFYTEQGAIVDRNPWPGNYAGVGVLRPGAANQANTSACYITRQGAAPTSSTFCRLDSLAVFNPAKNEDLSPLGTGRRQQYGMQLSGGSEAMRYFVSGEWEDETGLQILPPFERRRLDSLNVPIRDLMERPNVYNRGTVRANLNVNLPGNADLAVNTGYINSYFSQPQADNNANGWGPTLLGGLARPNPDNLATAYGFYPLGAVYQQEFGQDVDRFIGSTTANWRPLEWLSFRGNAGIDFTNRVDTQLCRLSECTSGAAQEGYRNDFRTRFYNYTMDLNGTGTWNLTPSWLTRTTVGGQFFRELFNRNGAWTSRLPPGAVTVSAGAEPGSDEATTESRTLGLFAQQDLAFADRLFLTAAVRMDDNSAFGADFDAVVYPKFSASWVVSEEPFLNRPTWMDQLRLRAAYGASGRQPGTTDAVQFFSASTATLNGTDVPAVVFTATGNANLKPERSTEFEAGVDFTVFSSRINGELTYYNKDSRDALVQRVLAPSLGAGNTSRFENLGRIRNWGWEWLLNTELVRGENFGLDFGVNGSHNSNEIVDLGDVPPIRGATYAQIEGYPLNSYWVRPITFSDADGDRIIDPEEVTVGDTTEFLGYSQPRTEIAFTGGVNLLQRRVRITALVDYKGGHKVYNNTERIRCQSFVNCQELYDPSVPLEQQARMVALNFKSPSTIAGYIEDASFFRLREVAVNFEVPERVVSRFLNARRATLSLSGRNLKVWTDYTGLDPESNYSQSDVQNDFLTQPPATYYTLRLTLGF